MSLPLLAYMAGGAVILPVVVGLFASSRLNRSLKPLLLLFGIHALLTVLQFALAFQGVNNRWTSHVYYIIEVVLLLRIYSLWTPSIRARTIFLGMTILYGAFWIASKFLFEQFSGPALYTPTVSRVMLLGSTLYILMVIATTNDRPLYFEPRFWFSAGFLVILAGSLMFYGFRTLFLDFSIEAMKTLWSIHWTITVFSNVLHVIGFLCTLRLPNTGGQLELAQ
jgi:hypothetical protein